MFWAWVCRGISQIIERQPEVMKTAKPKLKILHIRMIINVWYLNFTFHRSGPHIAEYILRGHWSAAEFKLAKLRWGKTDPENQGPKVLRGHVFFVLGVTVMKKPPTNICNKIGFVQENLSNMGRKIWVPRSTESPTDATNMIG